jgi:hypothetical protein
MGPAAAGGNPFASQSAPAPGDDDLLTAAEVKRVFGGITDMTLWRWIHGKVGFPPPVKIATRNYWRLGDIRRFREKLVAAAAA